MDNGTGSIIATNANSTYRGMSLSPDGNTLVYTSKYSDSQEKLVKKLSYDSNNGTPITTVGGYHPAWSPDGLSLNYEQLSAGIPRLYNKDLTSSNGSAIAPTNTRLSRSYFQTASCSDGIQNQDETAVDFGGVC